MGSFIVLLIAKIQTVALKQNFIIQNIPEANLVLWNAIMKHGCKLKYRNSPTFPIEDTADNNQSAAILIYLVID